MMDKDEKRGGAPSGAMSAALEVVGEALARLRFGAINLVVHDGKVLQIDITEKIRLPG